MGQKMPPDFHPAANNSDQTGAKNTPQPVLHGKHPFKNGVNGAIRKLRIIIGQELELRNLILSDGFLLQLADSFRSKPRKRRRLRRIFHATGLPESSCLRIGFGSLDS